MIYLGNYRAMINFKYGLEKDIEEIWNTLKEDIKNNNEVYKEICIIDELNMLLYQHKCLEEALNNDYEQCYFKEWEGEDVDCEWYAILSKTNEQNNHDFKQKC